MTSADGVRTKYLSSALEALLALRQTTARLGLKTTARPAAQQLGSALTQLSQRVALSRPIRRLVTQLSDDSQRSVRLSSDRVSEHWGFEVNRFETGKHFAFEIYFEVNPFEIDKHRGLLHLIFSVFSLRVIMHELLEQKARLVLVVCE